MERDAETSKILIVDDNPNNLYSFQAILRAPEIELLSAASGEQALQVLLGHPDVALIVMDVQMPGMDGFETAELIRGYPKFCDIPILFVTAVYRSDEFARRGFQTGASDYITKPVDNLVLESKVNVFLTLQKQKRQLAREVEARTRAEAQVRHLNAVLAAIRNVNQLIVREKERAPLIQQTCNCLIESGGYEGAWLALLDGEGRATLTGEAGLGESFDAVAQAMEAGEFPPCVRPALRPDRDVVSEVALEDCSGCSLTPDSKSRPAMIARLEYQGHVYGLLTVCLPTGIRSQPHEQALLAELAADLAFALHGIEQEEERQRTQEALIQAERLSAMGRIAASLAHEINNPIQAVVGCLGLARRLVEENADASRYMDVAIAELGRAARIVQQMRDLGRQSQGHKELARVDELVETVLTLTRNRARSLSVDIIFEREENLPPVPMVVDRVQQVFLNLVLNAIDAMPDGGELRIVMATTQEPEGVELSFADTGVGIPPPELKRLFEAFHSTKQLGLGLGLYISRNILQEHGGWIDVESEVDRGTTFTVWLPG